jgi:hypothetical protein
MPRTASLATLKTRNLTTVLAGILIFCCKTRTEQYGHNIPPPADHSDERDGADENGERIHHAITWNDYVQAEPDSEIQHYTDYAAVTADNVVVNTSFPRNFSNGRANQKIHKKQGVNA